MLYSSYVLLLLILKILQFSFIISLHLLYSLNKSFFQMHMLISNHIDFFLIVMLNFHDRITTMGLYFGNTVSLVVLLHHSFIHFLIEITCHSLNNLFGLLHYYLYFCFDYPYQLLNLCRIHRLVMNTGINLRCSLVIIA